MTMKKYSLTISLVLLLAPTPAFSFTLTKDFEGGTIGEYSISGNGLTHNQISSYYLFKLSGVKDQTITFKVIHKEKHIEDYSQYRGVISYDFINWRLADNPYESKTKLSDGSWEIIWKHTFSSDEVWVCSVYPWNNTIFQQFIDKHEDDENVVFEKLGMSPGKPEGGQNGHVVPRPYYLVTITDPRFPDKDKRVIWNLGEHQTETLGHLALYGMMRFLLSDDPIAVLARQKFILKAFPNMRPDAIAAGSKSGPYFRYSDDRENPTPEYAAYHKVLDDWYSSGQVIDMNIRHHSSMWNRSTLYVEYLVNEIEVNAAGLEFCENVINSAASYDEPKINWNIYKYRGAETTRRRIGYENQRYLLQDRIPSLLYEGRMTVGSGPDNAGTYENFVRLGEFFVRAAYQLYVLDGSGQSKSRFTGLKNGGFEKGLSAWSGPSAGYAITADAAAGAAALELKASGEIVQELPVDLGKTYQLSYRAKGLGEGVCEVKVEFVDWDRKVVSSYHAGQVNGTGSVYQQILSSDIVADTPIMVVKIKSLGGAVFIDKMLVSKLSDSKHP